MAFGAVFLPARAQEDFDTAFEQLDKAFEEAAGGEEQAWDKVDAALEAQWEEIMRKTEAEWEKLRAEVEQKWDEFYYSTNKEWVDYDANKDTRSRVNFKTGEIEVSTLVVVKEKPKAGEAITPAWLFSKIKPEERKHIMAQAEKRIVQQVEKIFSPANEVHQEVLKDLVKDEQGKVITTQNVATYAKEYVAPKIKLAKKLIWGKDGKKRLKFTAQIRMVPKHLQIRANRFKAQVKKYATKYSLDPALIFAVIHTESYFNPLAKSWVPAYGLMQLVPRYGAMEAYYYLYNEKKLLPADYLYNPENNIMLGATYLHLLQDKYFGQVKNAANRQSLCIAAYNSGPTRLNKKVVRKYDVNHMENGKLVEIIRKVVPKETKDYVLKVQKRIALYKGMI